MLVLVYEAMCSLLSLVGSFTVIRRLVLESHLWDYSFSNRVPITAISYAGIQNIPEHAV